MTLDSNSDLSIFKDGRLKPGIYKIQNLYAETYLDIHQHSKGVCCRPGRDLEDGRGLVRLCLPSAIRLSDAHKWEIKTFGVGYTVRRVEPGKPEQFCTPMEGLNDATPLYVNAYPVAWRVETVNDGIHSGFEYFLLGTHEKDLGSSGGLQRQRYKGAILRQYGIHLADVEVDSLELEC
ncbi:hypothetical protein BDM02DRAFT_2708081 [Thelephora ganbajun]|uniref:Uncharacterized protein n=1 Tax=Thelephora ganbajun TaxID=370292 RepID=A0ACB6YY66_THEGA|nr:hypothetical protein BDM02DRAFT_2708081 [Thelephora ganbajun]